MLIAFLAAIRKELLLLRRDLAGLLILFLMPAALVLITTLVQNNVMSKIGDTATQLLLVDQDKGMLATALKEQLKANEKIIVQERQDLAQSLEEVRQGRYQVALLIKAESSQALQARLNNMLSEEKAAEPLPTFAAIELVFDPTAIGAFRSAMQANLQLALRSIEFNELLKALNSQLAGYGDFSPLPAETNLEELGTTALLSLSEVEKTQEIRPTAVQQNVPAWALFGLFFMVVPLSGSLIFERSSGTLDRLLVMPSPLAILLLGKISAYSLVGCGQCLLIWALGRFILPLLGLPAFSLGSHPAGVALMVVAAICAASSYGILLGAACRTYDQASMFGAISVVIAAAIGGVMAPVHAMPPLMQKLSTLSPLGWALDGLLTICVRQGTIDAITRQAGSLLLFSLVCAGLAWYIFQRRERKA